MNNVLEYLEKSIENNPSKTAVIYEKQSLSYEILGMNMMKVGTAIGKQTSVRKPIVVLMEKSIDALIACFGSIYAGCYYVNVSPSQPESRINDILEITNPALIIVDDSYDIENLHDVKNYSYITYSQLSKTDIDYGFINKIRGQSLDIDPIYCNFTSGSTGKPKGVVVAHRSVIDFMNYFPSLFNFTQDDVFANQAPLHFDVSIKDIFSSFKVGGTLLLIPKKYFSIVTQLLDYLDDNKATVLIWAVSALCMIPQFRGFKYKVPSSISKVLFSGELMPNTYLKTWMELYPQALFVNLYGPTEITCNCTYYQVPKTFDFQTTLPIGKPFLNEGVFLLNEQNELLNEKGDIGELCVIGSCLSLGYLNNLESTKKAFVQNPLQTSYPQLMYKTGDLAYYNEEGNLVFAGRSDFQIKHKGFRIELEDIEHALHKVNGLTRAVCHYDQKKSKIIGYYVGEIEAINIKKALDEILPQYMIPTSFYKLDELPVSDNGKINRGLIREIYEGNN